MAEKSLEAHFIKCLKEGNTKKALYIVELLGDKVNALYGAKSLLVFAKEFENDEVARVLEEKGAREIISDEEAKKLGIELIEKAKVGDLDAIIEFVGKGAKVDEKDNNGNTPLMRASANGHVDVVKTLIENGAKVDEKNKDGNTPLMWASADGHVVVVKTLIEKGAKVDEKDNRGYTALIWASENGHVKIAKALLDAGADVNIKNEFGETTMSLTKYEEIRRVIIEAVKKRKEKQNEPGFMEKMKGLFGKGE